MSTRHISIVGDAFAFRDTSSHVWSSKASLDSHTVQMCRHLISGQPVSALMGMDILTGSEISKYVLPTPRQPLIQSGNPDGGTYFHNSLCDIDLASSVVEQYGHLRVGDSSKILGTGGTRKTYFPPLIEDTYSVRGRPEKVAESFKSDFATVEKLCLVP